MLHPLSVGDHIKISIWHNHHVVFSAAKRLNPFAMCRTFLVNIPCDRRGATKLTAFTSGCSSNASTATLSPFTTLNTPSGKPASFSQSAMSIGAEGSRSLGFKIKVLPVASAMGNIHIGTIAGKLNGVMPATTPRDWRTMCYQPQCRRSQRTPPSSNAESL